MLLDAGAALDDTTVAAWEVEGAALRKRGDSIEVVDDGGMIRLRVTAPLAYAAGGRAIEPKLSVQGARIELSVDAGGEAVLVDPAWMPASAMTTARRDHTSTRLLDGRVLVTGGFSTPSTLASAEVYDPTANTWTAVAPMGTARREHTMTVLPAGGVLVAGGMNAATVAGAELYDPRMSTWTPAASMDATRAKHTATLLDNGQVLVAGGYQTDTPSTSSRATAELYDPALGVWSGLRWGCCSPRAGAESAASTA